MLVLIDALQLFSWCLCDPAASSGQWLPLTSLGFRPEPAVEALMQVGMVLEHGWTWDFAKQHPQISLKKHVRNMWDQWRTIFTQKWVLRNQAFLGKYMITYCCRSRFCLSSYIIKHVFHVRGRRGRKVAMCLWGKLQKHVCFKVSQEVVRPFCVAGDVVYNVWQFKQKYPVECCSLII